MTTTHQYLERKSAPPMTAKRAFWTAALRRPMVIGAIGPSGPRLARRLAEVVPSGADATVVEIGPGTGPISAAIQQRLAGHGRHVAVEIDPMLVDYLRGAFPAIEVVHGDARALDELLAEHSVGRVDAVVSGLPWTLFPPDKQRAILGKIAGCLSPGGVFTTFAYLNTVVQPSSRRFLSMLRETFDEVLPTRAVWGNYPPAVTYVCRRPY